MPELTLEIAGFRTSLVTQDRVIAGLIRDRYKGFLSDGAPEWRIEVGTKPGLRLVTKDVVVRPNGGPDQFLMARYDFFGTVDLRERSGRVDLIEPDEISLDSFLRIAYSLALVGARGLLLHAASLVRGGKGHLFCGPSGSGKTTVSRLSPDATLLSDELSIIRLWEGRAVSYGTPFWGELARGGENLSAPLSGLYFLRKSDRHAVEALRPREALERLLPNVVFFAREADLTGRLLEVSAALVEAVPCFDLFFLPDPGFWRVVENA